MGYFSNGTEANIWQSTNCDGCVHDNPENGCAVMLVHLMFNYDQFNNGNEQLKEALDLLIPEDSDGMAGTCKMRIPTPAPSGERSE